MIKTFRGLLDDGEQDKIRLSTKKGKIGYRIVKFEMLPYSPGIQAQESVMKVFKVEQGSVTNICDFSDGNLLAAGIYNTDANTADPMNLVTIFDLEIFNQDIYITHIDTDSSRKCNYYLELEVVPLSDNAAAVSTLRDIRLNPQVAA
jgi:hypothetical protein